MSHDGSAALESNTGAGTSRSESPNTSTTRRVTSSLETPLAPAVPNATSDVDVTGLRTLSAGAGVERGLPAETTVRGLGAVLGACRGCE